MKRAFFLSISLLLSNSFFAEGESFSCDPKKYLPEDLANKVLVHRESGFNICLSFGLVDFFKISEPHTDPILAQKWGIENLSPLWIRRQFYTFSTSY